MPAIDESELRRALSAMEAVRPNRPRASLAGRRERLVSRRAIDQSLATSFAKAGVDIDKLNRMLADEQSEQRRRLETQTAEAAKRLPAAHQAFRRAADNRRKSLELLAGLEPLPVSSFVNLTPFKIFEEVSPPSGFVYLVGSHIEQGNSWVKCNVTARANSDSTTFDYWFLWENRDWPVVVNVNSSLVFTGHCFVSAAPGIFFGEITQLFIGANLTLWEWWTSPQTPISAYNSETEPVVASLYVVGSGLFGFTQPNPGEGQWAQEYLFSKYDLSYNMFFIPAGATAVFTVSFSVGYSTDDYLNISNSALADFATDRYFGVVCPGLQLEVLTVPPVAG
jgi:hypothetical protein